MPSASVELSREELLATNQQQSAQIERLEAENDWLRAQFKLAQHKLYGSSSERTPDATLAVTDAQAELLFNEAEVQSAPEVPEPSVETITSRRRKQKGRREEQLEGLPVEEVRHEIPESERVCPQCAGALHAMGEEVRQELKIVPAQASVVRHVQIKYACRHCALHDTRVPVVTAPMPAPAFPNSLASPSSVAYVMNGKFELGLPLYRQEQHFRDLGLELSRQTLANWMLKGADRLVPLYNRLRQLLLARDILHADETTVQVLHEAGRAAQTQSYMWVYHSGREGPAMVLYDYRTTRAATHPREFLRGFTGYLHVDGYQGYDGLPEVTLAGCWAHARRKFDEALKAAPPTSRAPVGGRAASPPLARAGLDFCNRLFKIESELRDATPEERHALRLQRSQLILDEFRVWLDRQSVATLPKSALGQAVGYCRNQWPKLNVFLQDGRLELDNNRCERAIKPFVIGRKNWLFANTPRGATASAIIYSIVETARENGLCPLDYLTLLFQRLPNIDTDDATAIDALLPWTHDAQARCADSH